MQNLGGGIKGKRNSTIEATGLFVLEAGHTPCKLWDRSRFVPLASSPTSSHKLGSNTKIVSLGFITTEVSVNYAEGPFLVLLIFTCMCVYLTADCFWVL